MEVQTKRLSKDVEEVRVTPSLKRGLAALSSTLLDANGIPRVLPASTINAIDRNLFRIWCNTMDIWTYPTLELIEFLNGMIPIHPGGAKTTAIEVAAGKGYLGLHLGITSTDHYGRDIPDYDGTLILTRGRPAVEPLPHVIKATANEAVVKYQPKVVIASWMMHYDTKLGASGNMWGCNEYDLLDALYPYRGTYIHIGNYDTHIDKPILGLSHWATQLPGLVTKASDPSKDVIFVWNTADLEQEIR